jgi:hypothetical protein
MSPYQTHYYWEHQLENNHSFWKTVMPAEQDLSQSIFVHTAIVGYQANLLDFNWTYYSEPTKLLGFLQYIYVPAAFYHWLNPKEENVLIPLIQAQELAEYFQEFPINRQEKMAKELDILQSFWEIEDPASLLKVLIEFAEKFNQTWQSSNLNLGIHIFAHTSEIAEHLLKLSEFPEILMEDFGMDEIELRKMCAEFYTNKMIQRNFLSLLQNRIGCIT